MKGYVTTKDLTNFKDSFKTNILPHRVIILWMFFDFLKLNRHDQENTI